MSRAAGRRALVVAGAGEAAAVAAGMAGIRLQASANDGLQALLDGRPVRLAVVDDDGTVLAVGAGVAQAAEASSVEAYRLLLRAQGHLLAVSGPVSSAV